MDKFDAAVPLCSLMEYIAGYVTKSKVLVTKARLTKAVALGLGDPRPTFSIARFSAFPESCKSSFRNFQIRV